MSGTTKKELVRDLCLLMGWGEEGARPDNQFLGDGYFGLDLSKRIKASGIPPEEIEAEAKAEAKRHLIEQLKKF